MEENIFLQSESFLYYIFMEKTRFILQFIKLWHIPYLPKAFSFSQCHLESPGFDRFLQPPSLPGCSPGNACRLS